MKIVTLPLFLALAVSACTSVKNPGLAAKVDKIRIGQVSAAVADAKTIEENLQPSRFKEHAAQSVLLLAGGILAGSIGGQQGINNYIAMDAGARAGAAPKPPVDMKGPAEKEFALQSRILELSAKHQPAALAKALQEYDATKGRLAAKADWRLDCRVNYVGHDVRKKHHYVWLEGEVKLYSPTGEVVWEDSTYGDSDTGYGGAAAVLATTPEALLVPETLSAHVKAAMAYLAMGVAESLADALKWDK
jgi:hypothetical protein